MVSEILVLRRDIYLENVGSLMQQLSYAQSRQDLMKTVQRRHNRHSTTYYKLTANQLYNTQRIAHTKIIYLKHTN